MSQKIRMVAIDLDGTLLNSSKQISPVDREALCAAAALGVEIVPVTGRNFHFALPHLQDESFVSSMITSNGAVIRSLDGKTHFRCAMSRDAASWILKASREYRPYCVVVFDQAEQSQFWMVTANGKVAPVKPVAESAWVRHNPAVVRFVPSLEDGLPDDPLQVLFTGPWQTVRDAASYIELQLADTEAAPHRFRLLRTEYPKRDFAILDVVRADCSKGHALEYWSRQKGIPPEAIMAIGDNYNDLDMLEFAGLPVVMGNAEDALLRIGWQITADCDSGGVAQAIRQFVL
ncbi:MAG: hypothetical protein A3F68_01995 [Acidobacteria bacterium RIFCSPLOWO2_12_FULL_54_10]|nr:MAG: hypothetical protein A3F68_01995 [Acidobacteria bacterium RIFCSPLOWO2_12_FULL_54_10]